MTAGRARRTLAGRCLHPPDARCARPVRGLRRQSPAHALAPHVLAPLAGHRDQGIHPAQARPADLRHDPRHPHHPVADLRLRHQLRPQASAHRGAAARVQPVHARLHRGHEEQRLFRHRRHGEHRTRGRAHAGPRRRAVRGHLPAGFPARADTRRTPRHPGAGRCHRPGGRERRAVGAQPHRQRSVRARPAGLPSAAARAT